MNTLHERSALLHPGGEIELDWTIRSDGAQRIIPYYASKAKQVLAYNVRALIEGREVHRQLDEKFNECLTSLQDSFETRKRAAVAPFNNDWHKDMARMMARHHFASPFEIDGQLWTFQNELLVPLRVDSYSDAA